MTNFNEQLAICNPELIKSRGLNSLGNAQVRLTLREGFF